MLVVPVDLPDLDVRNVQILMAALSTAQAVCFQGHPLPWAARVDARLRGIVDDVMRDAPQGPSMRALHAAVGGIEIEVLAPLALRNLNAPADFEARSR